MKKVKHELDPFYNQDSKILILGTIPSPKSRELGFYYMHPQNRFWKVLSDVLNEEFPVSIEDKKNLLTKHDIALWDVLSSCQIEGASDASIKSVKENDIRKLINNSNVKQVFVTGKTAEKYYNKLCYKKTEMPCIYLPSTSPANCSVKYEQLKEAFKIINEFL